MRLIEAFANSTSIFALVDIENGAFIEVNDAFERQLGYTRAQAIGKIPFELGMWPSAEFRSQVWSLLREQRRAVSLVTEVVTADGRKLHGFLSVEPVLDNGQPALLCLLQLDDRAASLPLEPGEKLYRSLYLAATEGIYRSLPGGGFIDVNPAMARLLGYESPLQLLAELSRNSGQIYVDQVAVTAMYARLREGARVDRVRMKVRQRHGREIWVSENSRGIRNETGRVLFYEGSMVDITAQVEAETALNQSQALYRVLVDNSRDGVFLIQSGQILFANEGLANMLGYTQAELLGFDYLSLVHPDDRPSQMQRKSARESGSQQLQAYEIHVLRKDGSMRLFEVRADAVEYMGKNASTGTMRDITDAREQQLALEAAEHRYRALFEDSPAGLFRTALDGAVLEINEVLARMLGYPDVAVLRSEIKDMLQVYADPEQRNAMLQLAISNGSFSQMEIQICTRGGGRRWVSASVRANFDGEGKPQSFTGSVLDIDRHHAMQQALQASEERYRTLVEDSQVGVFIMRGDRYTYVNPAFAAMLGYRESELIGLDYRQIMAKDAITASEERDRMRQAGQAVATDFETCLVHRDAHRVYVRVSIGPVELDGEVHLTGTVLDVTGQHEAERRLRFHASHDSLTGLPNRLVFNGHLTQRLRKAEQESSYDYCVLFLDLDGFKWVNDSLGHGVGDRLLIDIARRLENHLIKDMLIARYGGDEFTLMPEGPCDQERALELARRVLMVFEQPFEISGQQVFSAASIGIVMGRQEYESPDQVLRDADTAMYRAKAAGKSGFVIFDETMHREARIRFQLENDFRLAFERTEFRLHYQPIIDLASGRLVAAEALVRWQHPSRGLLAPAEFLPIAEETGLITDLDAWVLREATRQLSDWRQRHPGMAHLALNVNVDERQLGSADILQEVSRLLDVHGLPPASLRLEVTETVFRTGRVLVEQRLMSLKALGIGLIVDDFGTGYSSLESFAASPFDALKVDQVFVRDLETNPRHRAIVRTIIGFARDLGLVLTAEGIETQAQRKLLLELGCQFGQGYLFNRPLTPADFELRLQWAVTSLS